MTKEEAKAIAAEFRCVAGEKGFTFNAGFFQIEGRRGSVWKTKSNGYSQVPGCTVEMDGIYGSGSSLLPAKSFNIESIEDVPRVVELVINRAKLLAATYTDFREKVCVAREQKQQEEVEAEELVRAFASMNVRATRLSSGDISLSPEEAKAVIETMKRAGKNVSHSCFYVNGGPCKILWGATVTYQEALAWVEALPIEVALDLGGPYSGPRIALAHAIQQLVTEERQCVIDEVWHSVAPTSTYAKFSTEELRSEVENTRKVLENISEQEGIKR